MTRNNPRKNTERKETSPSCWDNLKQGESKEPKPDESISQPIVTQANTYVLKRKQTRLKNPSTHLKFIHVCKSLPVRPGIHPPRPTPPATIFRAPYFVPDAAKDSAGHKTAAALKRLHYTQDNVCLSWYLPHPLSSQGNNYAPWGDQVKTDK